MARVDWKAWGRQWNDDKFSYFPECYRDLCEADMTVHDLQTPKDLPPMQEQPVKPLEVPDAPWVSDPDLVVKTRPKVAPALGGAWISPKTDYFDTLFEPVWGPALMQHDDFLRNPILLRIQGVMDAPAPQWTFATPFEFADWLYEHEVTALRLFDGALMMSADGPRYVIDAITPQMQANDLLISLTAPMVALRPALRERIKAIRAHATHQKLAAQVRDAVFQLFPELNSQKAAA